VDDGIVVSYSDFGSHWGTGADITADGVTWTPWCGPSVGTPCDKPTLSYMRDQRPVCVPSHPNICFRPWGYTIGVDRSDDGGATWNDEWGLSWEEGKLIFETAGGPYSEDEVATLSLGILDLPSGFLVIAANGLDGIAVRDSDGTWERRGFLDSSCCRARGTEYPPVDLSAAVPEDSAPNPDASAPNPDASWQDSVDVLPYSAVAVGAGFAVAAWWIAFEVALFGSWTREEAPTGLRGRAGRGWRWVASGLLLTMGLGAFGYFSVMVAQTIDENRREALNPPMDDGFGFVMIPLAVIVLVAAGSLLSLAARSAAPLQFRSGAWRTWLGAAGSAVIAMTVALIAGRMAHVSWVVGVATGAALLATLPPVLVLSRRAADRWQAARAAKAAKWRDPWRAEDR